MTYKIIKNDKIDINNLNGIAFYGEKILFINKNKSVEYDYKNDQSQVKIATKMITQDEYRIFLQKEGK